MHINDGKQVGKEYFPCKRMNRTAVVFICSAVLQIIACNQQRKNIVVQFLSAFLKENRRLADAQTDK